MLSLFSIHAFSVLRLTQPVTPSSKEALFNVQLINSGTNKINLTQNGRGFFIGYKVSYDNGTTSPVRLLSQQQTTYDGITIKYSNELKKAGQSLDIKFTVTNDNYFARNVSLGVFVDCNFKKGDTNTLRPLDGYYDYNRGFVISSADTYNYTILVRNVGDFPNVDTLYYADYGDPSMIDATYYPYFMASGLLKTSASSRFAFSWQDREIYKNHPQTFGFTIIPTDTINTPPRLIEAIPHDKSANKVGDKLNFLFYALDYDASENISISLIVKNLYTEFYHKSEHTVQTNAGEKAASAVINDFVLGEKGIYVQCTAKDGAGNSPKEISYFLYPNNAPTFDTFTGLKEKYYSDEKIEVQGTIKDEDQVDIKYRINNGPVEDLAWGVSKNFKGTIEIPKGIKKRVNYTIKFWIVDEHEVESAPLVKHFYLRAPENPQLLSAYSSDYSYIKGENTDLIIFGEAEDQDEGQLLTLYSQFAGFPRNKLGNHRNRYGLDPFAFALSVPTGIQPGIHPLTLDVVDDTNLTGYVNRSFNIRICSKGEVCEEPVQPTESPSQPSSIRPTNGQGPSQEDDNTKKDYKSRMPAIWVLTVFNIIAVIILLVIGVFWVRKKMVQYDEFNDDTTTGADEISESNLTPAVGSASQTADNPLFDSGIPQSDEVFANDYMEETTVDVFKFNNDEDDHDIGV